MSHKLWKSDLRSVLKAQQQAHMWYIYESQVFFRVTRTSGLHGLLKFKLFQAPLYECFYSNKLHMVASFFYSFNMQATPVWLLCLMMVFIFPTVFERNPRYHPIHAHLFVNLLVDGAAGARVAPVG